MESHREVCVYERVQCKYAALGCRETPRRKDINKHEEDDRRHLRVPLENVLDLMQRQALLEENMLTSSTASALESRISTVESKTDTLQSRTESRMVTLENGIAGLSTSLEQGLTAQRMVTDNLQTQITREIASNQETATNTAAEPEQTTPSLKCTPCTFKLTSFQEHKRNSDIFYSPSFLSSPGGYTMRIEVSANGSGEGWRTHVSVCVHLIQGDNDDSLTWPFNGQVTVELLNQQENCNHHKKTISLTSMASGEERSFTQFILHSDLERSRVFKKRLYLKDDTLFFRVSVQEIHYKPWLECTI